MATINERNRKIFYDHKSGKQVKEIADESGLSRSRVHQIILQEHRKIAWRKANNKPEDWEPDAKYLKEQKTRIREERLLQNPSPSAEQKRIDYLIKKLYMFKREISEIEKLRYKRNNSKRLANLTEQIINIGKMHTPQEKFKSYFELDIKIRSLGSLSVKKSDSAKLIDLRNHIIDIGKIYAPREKRVRWHELQTEIDQIDQLYFKRAKTLAMIVEELGVLWPETRPKGNRSHIVRDGLSRLTYALVSRKK